MVQIRSISLPPELLTVITRLANENKVSFSAELRRRLESSLTREEIIGRSGRA